jgi:hypothetical protein
MRSVLSLSPRNSTTTTRSSETRRLVWRDIGQKPIHLSAMSKLDVQLVDQLSFTDDAIGRSHFEIVRPRRDKNIPIEATQLHLSSTTRSTLACD